MKFANGRFQDACHTPSVLIGTVTASCDNLNLNSVHSNLSLSQSKAEAVHHPPFTGSYLIARR